MISQIQFLLSTMMIEKQTNGLLKGLLLFCPVVFLVLRPADGMPLAQGGGLVREWWFSSALFAYIATGSILSFVAN